MKKLMLLILSFLCILALFFTKSKLQNHQSLMDIYFTAANSASIEGVLDKSDLTKLLKGYSFEEGTTISDENYDCVETPYIYKTDNEKLVVYEHKDNDSEDVSMEYQLSTNSDLLNFAFNQHRASSYFTLESEDINLHFDIANALDSEKSNYKDVYYKVSKSISSSEHLTIELLKTLLNQDPLAESDSNINIYTFSQDNEILRVSCLRDDNSIVKVVYGNDTVGKKEQLTTTGKELLEEGNDVLTSVKSFTEDIDMQRKILDKFVQ
ncbi:MAG: hypothetical protein ACRC92_03860 [Peptostreptococcaceae bacterium]